MTLKLESGVLFSSVFFFFSRVCARACVRVCTTIMSFAIFLPSWYCIVRAPPVIFVFVVVVAVPVVAVVPFFRIFIVNKFLFCCIFSGTLHYSGFAVSGARFNAYL